MPEPKKQDQSISDFLRDITSWLGQGLSTWRANNQAAEPTPPVSPMEPGPIIAKTLEQTPDSDLNGVAKWAKKDGLLQRVLKSENPMGEPLLPKAGPSTTPEPDTYWGGFAKGLKDYGKDIYNDVIRPQANLTAPAMLLGGEDSLASDALSKIPAGLSKVEFANLLQKSPQLAEVLMQQATAPKTVDTLESQLQQVLGRMKNADAAVRDAASAKAAANPSLMEPFQLLGQVPSELLPQEAPTSLSPEEAAKSYAASKGLTYQAHEPVKVNKEFAKNVAQAYDQLKHDPNDPAVKKAYDALRSEVSEQFQHITKQGGLKVEPWTKEGQPYTDSKAMMADVRKNNHLFYFPTASGFGDAEVADHPLLQPGKSGLPANDELRIVHDYLAHAAGGHGFGPNGEENAFIEHAKLLSPEARKALATETRGQNSWVNFHANHEDLPQGQRPFATQKAGLLPDELQEVYPGKKRTPPATKAPLPSDKRMSELVAKFGGTSPAAPSPASVEDMLSLEHRSPKTNLSEVDPSFYGTGQAGAEKSRQSDPDFIKRSYFNVEGKSVEKRFQKLPTYTGQVPKKAVYSITEDPLNLKRQAQDLSGGDPDIARTLFERLIVSNGFKGYSDGTTVALFDKLPVTKKVQ